MLGENLLQQNTEYTGKNGLMPSLPILFHWRNCWVQEIPGTWRVYILAILPLNWQNRCGRLVWKNSLWVVYRGWLDDRWIKLSFLKLPLYFCHYYHTLFFVWNGIELVEVFILYWLNYTEILKKILILTLKLLSCLCSPTELLTNTGSLRHQWYLKISKQIKARFT